MKIPFRDRAAAAIRLLFNLPVSEFDRLIELNKGGPVSSGVRVTQDTAMNFSAFFCGVMQIFQTIASLPFSVYLQSDEGKKGKYKRHPLYPLLNRKASPTMTSFTWKETMTHHAIVWGNGYSYITRDRSGYPAGFTLMNPARMSVDIQDGKIVYVFRQPQGDPLVYPREQIFHLPGFGFDGVQGYSLLTVARESVGLGLAMQEFTARFYGHGTHLGGVVKRPKEAGAWTDAARERFKNDWTGLYAGLENTSKVAVLEDGMEFTQLGMPLKDAEFLASKTFSIQDIARWLNIPPDKLKDLSRATFSNIEHQQISYLVDTIRPWFSRWESSVNAWLIPDREADYVFAEFIADALLRADIKTRYEALHVARQDGIITGNEWRAMENWNRTESDAGDKLLVNGNMIDVDSIGKEAPQKGSGGNDEKEMV